MKTNIFKLALIFAALLSLQFVLKEKTKIYLIGDSTCANKPLDDNPERGWGQVFNNFFTDDVSIENHAKNGRSTKSFRNEGLWKIVYDKLQPGDYVFIQFGHNDQKIADTTRYAEAHTTYKQNLIRYVKETRVKDAIPVLLTPVNRRKFDEKGNFIDQHGDWPVVVREVSAELNVPLIDMHKKSLNLFSNLGPDDSKKLFLSSAPPKIYKSLPNGKDDNTHFTRKGAFEVANMVASRIKELELPIAQSLLPELKYSNKAQGKVVALDYYYNHEMKKDADGKEYQFHYVWEDKENSGFYEVGNLCETLDADIYEIHTAPSFDELKKVSMYIIVDPDTPLETPAPNYIADSSIIDIVKWVKEGGVLLLLANDFGNCEFEHLNKLAENFGIHFNEDSRNKLNSTEFYKGKFEHLPDHPIFKKVKEIYMKEISTLKLSQPAEPILVEGKDIIIAGANFGDGFVFAVGDPWIYNEYFDNRKLPV